jgi:RNA polymerase sigma-70 factor (ECF subfamily)
VESYHALSIGILVLLEKLTPQERAIFLLKEVFAYDYYELAEMFDRTEDNCRQIFKRAKENLGKDARRFEVDVKLHEKMLNNFLSAISEGNMEHLIDLLKEDIVLFADGGGSAFPVKSQRLTAPLKPVYGSENVSRFLISGFPKMLHLPGLSMEIIIVNGLPSVVTYSGDSPVSIISIEPQEDRIRNVYLQTNPEKLKRFKKNS